MEAAMFPQGKRRAGMIGVILCAMLTTAATDPAVTAPDPRLVAVYPEIATLPPKRSMQVFGQTIRYYDVGKGPVLVLLHGTGDRAESWVKVIPALAKNHRVIAMDQLGFGESDKPLIAYRIETWVNMLGEMLRLQGVAHATLVGESLGGWIASQYALHSLDDPTFYPAVDKLILTGAAGIKPQPVPGASAINTGGGTSIEAIVKGLKATYRDPALSTMDVARRRFALSLATGPTYTVQSLASSMTGSDEYVDAKLSRLTLPTLIVWGADDATGVARSRGYAAGMPHAKQAAIPNCGHIPPFERPEAYLKVILPFIDG